MELYRNLKLLTETGEGFYSKIEQLGDRTYEIFTYGLVSYQSFKLPSALECRGIMFDITNEVPVVASRPMKKFFNWNEGDIDHSKNKVLYRMEKLDGSLISTYLHNGKLKLKSKASLTSIQCIEAMELLNSPQYLYIHSLIKSIVEQGYTVNMEYTSPSNQIVVPYSEAKLSILSVLDNITGEESRYFDKHILRVRAVQREPLTVNDFQSLVDSIKAETQGEGYVLGLETPEGEVYQIKVKNDRYCMLHHARDSIQTPKAILEIILKGGSDDLRGLFTNDRQTLARIERMESIVIDIFNRMIFDIKCICDANEHLPRKEYAIKMQKDHPIYFSALMGLYLKREVDFVKLALENSNLLFGDKGLGL